MTGSKEFVYGTWACRRFGSNRAGWRTARATASEPVEPPGRGPGRVAGRQYVHSEPLGRVKDRARHGHTFGRGPRRRLVTRRALTRQAVPMGGGRTALRR